MIDLHEVLAGKWEDGTRPADLFTHHISIDPEPFVPQILDGLRSGSARVQSGCAELASLLSEAKPDLLWSERQLFVANLAAKAPVLRWEAVCTIGNLAAIDHAGELRACIPAIEGLLRHDSIVLQGHAVRALAKMARAYPDEAAGILDHLTAAPAHFPGSRVGFLVEAMSAFAAYADLRPTARAFAAAYVGSDVKPVATKARRALRTLDG